MTLSSGKVELFNAEQSSTRCYSGTGTCHPASRAIDGNWDTTSRTNWATGTHWWQVSMSNTIVYQIVLKAWTGNDEEITVSLYSGETLAGGCESHTGDWGTETLSCDRVAADRVRLTMSSTSLWVYEIEVKGSINIIPTGERHDYMYITIKLFFNHLKPYCQLGSTVLEL